MSREAGHIPKGDFSPFDGWDAVSHIGSQNVNDLLLAWNLLESLESGRMFAPQIWIDHPITRQIYRLKIAQPMLLLF